MSYRIRYCKKGAGPIGTTQTFYQLQPSAKLARVLLDFCGEWKNPRDSEVPFELFEEKLVQALGEIEPKEEDGIRSRV